MFWKVDIVWAVRDLEIFGHQIASDIVFLALTVEYMRL
jgi:hypothetical protein